MREIKFRAWDKESKEMKYQSKTVTFEFADGYIGYDDSVECSWTGSLNQEIMQSTGLKDKNGKEIYEGDIVKTDRVLKPFVVKDIRLDTLKIARRIVFERDNPTAYRFKVIGNIYENKGLLK